MSLVFCPCALHVHYTQRRRDTFWNIGKGEGYVCGVDPIAIGPAILNKGESGYTIHLLPTTAGRDIA